MRNAANTAVLFATAIAGSLSFVGRLFSDGAARKRRRIDVGKARKAADVALSARNKSRRSRP